MYLIAMIVKKQLQSDRKSVRQKSCDDKGAIMSSLCMENFSQQKAGCGFPQPAGIFNQS